MVNYVSKLLELPMFPHIITVLFTQLSLSLSLFVCVCVDVRSGKLYSFLCITREWFLRVTSSDEVILK
jgi:hypothetical protein